MSVVSEISTNIRRWLAYVCPQCRGVFRAACDQEEVGVYCPHCRQLLKMPQISLWVQTKREEEERLEETRNHLQQQREKREALKTKVATVGAVVFLLLVFVIVGWTGRAHLIKPELVAVAQVPVQLESKPLAMVDPKPVVKEWTHEAFVKKAEPIARKFLQAKHIDQLLPLIRDADALKPALSAYYPSGEIESLGLSEFFVNGEVIRASTFVQVRVKTADYDLRYMTFIEGENGDLKVDWESWVGWSEMPWREFMKSKSREPKLFRVVASESDYYNFAFTDEKKYLVYRLQSPDGEHLLYGYLERSSPLAKQIPTPPEQKRVWLTVKLRYPEGAVASNQVLIESLVYDGWVR